MHKCLKLHLGSMWFLFWESAPSLHVVSMNVWKFILECVLNVWKFEMFENSLNVWKFILECVLNVWKFEMFENSLNVWKFIFECVCFCTDSHHLRESFFTTCCEHVCLKMYVWKLTWKLCDFFMESQYTYIHTHTHTYIYIYI